MQRVSIRINYKPHALGELFLFDGPLIYPQRLHRHKALEANLVTEGTATYLIEDTRVELTQGTLLWLFPDQHHTLLTKSDTFRSWVVLWNTPWVRQITREAKHAWLRQPRGVSLHYRLLSPGTAHKLYEMLLDCQAVADSPDTQNLRLGSVLHELNAAYQAGTPFTRGERLHPAVLRAIKLLEEVHPTTNKLPHMAETIGLSYSRLSRLFIEQTKCSLGDFRDKCRLHRCMDSYHLHPNWTLLACALDAGFGSYSQFYRSYQKHFGTNPRQLQRE